MRIITLLAMLIMAATGSAARAADLKHERYAVTGDTYSWEGFYAGIHGGVADGQAITAAKGTPDQLMDGAAYGVQVGYNRHLLSGLVLGFELDASIGDMGDTVKDGNYITQDGEVNLFGTARLRLGYAVDRWMIYGTAGAAWMDGSTGEQCPKGAPFGHCKKAGAYDEQDNFFQFGWAAGGGIEFALLENVTLRAEYLHLDFGTVEHELGPKASAREISREADVIRGGLNYRF